MVLRRKSMRGWKLALLSGLVGMILGGGIVYVLVTNFGPIKALGLPGGSVPDPAEAEGEAALRTTLEETGIDAKVLRFQRTGWDHNIIRLELDRASNNTQFSNLPRPYRTYSLAYEADLVFAREAQIKETWTLLWAP